MAGAFRASQVRMEGFGPRLALGRLFPGRLVSDVMGSLLCYYQPPGAAYDKHTHTHAHINLGVIALAPPSWTVYNVPVSSLAVCHSSSASASFSFSLPSGPK